ncbi:sulfatase [Bordetella ansorpii]|uniref:Sulfatase n=1 Tax=Bordetella ansorpii TaxID=288768 RepID=A0A157QZ84_9BORD|nr:sulfatase-like hydrolase/transferase [Bordetella ansorpii]SAI50926.1 sulfatase [Bordetella ansorpii]
MTCFLFSKPVRRSSRAVRLGLAVLAAACLAACGGKDSGDSSADTPTTPPVANAKPNILFVIMDDVGIDQMSSFGYGGATPPPMPNIDAISQAGIKFRNTWSMPECSPGRAAFFVGRYPLRTHVYQAIGPNDLANSQISPYDQTAPKLLKQAGYVSGMFGKFHLAGPENNQAGNSTPAQLGWDYFYGWIGGLPGSIDTTAGGAHAQGSKVCGFDQSRIGGACYHADGTCQSVPAATLTRDAPGLQCLTQGGVFASGQACGASAPAGLNFSQENAYYVSPLVIVSDGKVEEVPLTDARARGYRTTIETDAAIRWIKSRPADQPWMATVSYSAAHTPWQQAPGALAPRTGAGAGGDVIDTLDCTSNAAGRIIQNQMTEAMDTEFGRLMVETGLATRNDDGSLAYDPKASNTMIVIVGDNGTLGYTVKAPFNQSLAKGTSYQTGVWVPLIVAGPKVAQPGREVAHMTNTVDLFQLFGELAGLDVPGNVPRTIDSAPMLPYLSNPGQASVRTLNFTQADLNLQANGATNSPCVINRDASNGTGGTCTQIPVSKSVCEDNGGVWWGAGYTDASVVPNGGAGYTRCWEANQAIYKNDAASPLITVLTQSSVGIRDDDYKVVRTTLVDYDSVNDTSKTVSTNEFYEVDEAPGAPKIEDPSSNNLLAGTLSASQQSAYDTLTARMDEILASEPECPGDGNKDGVVDSTDVDNAVRLIQDWGKSSVYDFPAGALYDGKTDADDLSVVQRNMNVTCPKSHARY